MCLGVAMSEQGEGIELTEWVKLRPKSNDSHWESKMLCAVVARNLCTPIILGDPFLSANSVIIDHQNRTVVSSLSQYDLFNSPPPAITQSSKPTLLLKKKALEIISSQMAAKKKVLHELGEKLAPAWDCYNTEHCADAHRALVATICARIDTLTTQDGLRRHNEGVR